MKKRNIYRSTLLAVLLILGSGSVLAWAKTDTIPPYSIVENVDSLFGRPVEIHISIADLPALLDGRIVAITLDQMDTLTVDMINLEAANEKNLVYEQKLDTAYMEIHKRDFAIHELTVLDDFNKREVEGKNFIIAEQDLYINHIEKDLRKQKRKTGFAWFIAGLGTAAGFAGGFMLAK